MARSSVSGGGGASVSYGSNATTVSDANAGGASTTVSRSDHRHGGVAAVTSSSSNTMALPTINLRAGGNVGFGLDLATNTLTISTAAASTPLSYASNSTTVGTANAAGASDPVSRADHVHAGVAAITASSSNTLTPAVVNLRPGNNVALAVDAATNTVTISAASLSGGSFSYGSNANDVGATSSGGASPSISRADHVHAGASLAYASNSNSVGTANAAGASSLVSRGDHVHSGKVELDYVETTSTLSVTQTTEANANTYVTANAITFDGSTAIWVEAGWPFWNANNGAVGRSCFCVLFDNGSSIGLLTIVNSLTTSAQSYVPTQVARKITPAAGSHQYSIRFYQSGGNGGVGAGSGGTGNYMPGWIRITRA